MAEPSGWQEKKRKKEKKEKKKELKKEKKRMNEYINVIVPNWIKFFLFFKQY